MKNKSEISKLEKEIKKHKVLYYQGMPEIEDHEFDELEDKLKKLFPESSVLKMVGTDKLAGKKNKTPKENVKS